MRSWRDEKSVYRLWETKGAGLIQMPEQVRKWFGELILMGEVPLSYLVADERELPVESIRFFVLDPQWTQALVDGASSIGVLTKLESVRSLGHLPLRYGSAKETIRLPRYGRMHPNHRRENCRMTADSNAVLSGFLMRSDLVSNWKGIEVKGFYKEGQIDILRMERLSDKLLICIFEGVIDSVRMYEPREELHFGTRSDDRQLDVRRIDDGHEGEPLYKPGTKDKVTITVPTEDNGRVKFTQLAQLLAQTLGKSPEAIESPQLALEMLSVAGQCVFEGGK
jgi:hypothetical protein